MKVIEISAWHLDLDQLILDAETEAAGPGTNK
jgi:hypothetical protein